MFIDSVTIAVKGGTGGNGCVSFRREKHVPRGGPDGGNGGKGGEVVIRVDPHMRTLLDLRYRRVYKAEDGNAGQGKRRTGKSGSATIISVPAGTIVQDARSGEQLVDLIEGGQEIVIARGGRGGKGNHAFRSPTDQAPRKSTNGTRGEERELVLTLKLIADVGLVGLPNAGKSTLLRAVSDAHPVVAPYPFSTVAPVLGIVPVDVGASFCMIDIPGLIEGAHMGKGLGIQFLRHIERCRILLFLLDAAGEISPGDAYRQLLQEIGLYSAELLERPRFVALNKVDLVGGSAAEIDFEPRLGEPLFLVSALTGDGIQSLVKSLYRIIQDPQSTL